MPQDRNAPTARRDLSRIALFSLAWYALVLVGRALPRRRPETPAAAPDAPPVIVVRPPLAPLEPRERVRVPRRLATTLVATAVFFGAAFAAVGSDRAVHVLEGDVVAEAPAQDGEAAPAAPDASAPAPSAEPAPAPAAEPAPAPEAEPAEAAPEAAAVEATAAPAAAYAPDGEAAPAAAAEPAVEPAVEAAAAPQPDPAPVAPPAAAPDPEVTPASPAAASEPVAVPDPDPTPVAEAASANASSPGRTAASAAPRAAVAPAARPHPAQPTPRPAPKPVTQLDPEAHAHGFAPTVWLHRVLPDPLPPALRLTPEFMSKLRTTSRTRGVDWALVLGVLRAQGARGAVPARPATIAEVAGELRGLRAGGDAWNAALGYTGRTSGADRAVALAHYYRAIGPRALVRGLEREGEALAARVLRDESIAIYAAGRDDIANGKVAVQILALVAYLDEIYDGVTVSSLISGHRIYSRPGVVSAHVYGQAVDIAALGGAPIMGNSRPGGLTERAVRDILLLPAEMRPRQVISLLGLGGPSFPLADHADHIHVGY